MIVCVCVCVPPEREREKDREREKERERQQKAFVCALNMSVCVHPLRERGGGGRQSAKK